MEALGINLSSFLFQLGNFVVLFAILSWLLHKPLLKLLEDRRTEISEGLRNAQEARQQLESAEKRQAEILEKARKDGVELLKETKQQAEELREKLKATAQAQAEQLRANMSEQVAAEGEELRRELKKELADMVVTATKKALKEQS